MTLYNSIIVASRTYIS